MHIDPQLYDHVEIMVCAALARNGVVDAVSLSGELGKAPDEASPVLASLAAAGLLCPVGGVAEHSLAYRLARAPEAIGLHEVAGVAGYSGANDSDDTSGARTGADNGTRSLTTALQNQTREALARFTLADVLPSSADGLTRNAPWISANGSGQAAQSGARARNDDRSALGQPARTRLGMTVDDLWQLVDTGDVPVVIDVRANTDSTWPAPPWAHWLALEDFDHHTPGWPADVCIVNVCGLGVRSLIAAAYLRWNGHSRAHYLIGGLEAWHRA